MAGAISITASAFLPSPQAIFRSGTAGATITQGQPLYIDTASNFVLKLADSNASQATAIVCGIAANAASAGQPIQYVVSDPALTIGSTQLSGNDLWLFTTAGTMTITAADVATTCYAVHLGNYISTTQVNFLITQGGLVA